MFIVVLFGECQQELFNPDCKSILLIEDIKRRCNCKENEMIDLAEESGVVKNLHERPAEQFASEFLEDRRSYILVDVKKQIGESSSQVFKVYTALLNGLEETNPEFLAKIASQNKIAANANRTPKSAKLPKGKGNLRGSKNLSSVVPSSRSKSIVNKKKG